MQRLHFSHPTPAAPVAPREAIVNVLALPRAAAPSPASPEAYDLRITVAPDRMVFSHATFAPIAGALLDAHLARP